VRQCPWRVAIVAVLGLSGCLPASRGWVREQLAPVQVQVAHVRDRVAMVEEQFGRLDPKVDRILAQMEQQSTVASQHPANTRFTSPLPSPSNIPGNLPVETSLDLLITGGAMPLAGEATPRDCLLKSSKGGPCAGGTIPPRPAPGKALKPTPSGSASLPDCLLKTLKGERC
jgi:hypothetical protein